MLHTILNTQNDHNLDTFSKIIIYNAKDFVNFNRFTSINDLDNILSNINTNANVLFLDLLPENIRVNQTTAIQNNSKTFRTSISFTVTPQTEQIQEILSKFNNKEVFVCIKKVENQHIYGSTKEPLLFTFSELHNQQPGKIQGYTVSISGITIEKSRFITLSQINTIERLLASPLASQL